MRKRTRLWGAVGVWFFWIGSLHVSAQATNLAKGRPYTLTPRPNYALTTDAGDDTQLTDGAYTDWNPIWTRTSTVGWSSAAPVSIVIDLQSVQPIAGVSYSTAAGKAGVQWPRSIFVLTSDDGQHYVPAADLAAIPAGGASPPASGYAPFRFSTAGLRTHGRYVAILVDQQGPFTFCDEIEVLAGDVSWLALPLAGEMTTDLPAYFVSAHMGVSIRGRLSNDLQDARTALETAPVDDVLRAQLASTLDQAAAEIPDTPVPAPNTFTTVLPLNDLHRQILSVQGAIARAEGLPPLAAWAANPWDFVRPLDKPPTSGGPGTVRIAAMNGETRAGAVNFSNATDQKMVVSLQLSDPKGKAVSDVQLYEVLWTDTRELIPVADALIPLPSTGAMFEIPAGMTRQVWMRFTAQNRLPGTYRGSLDAMSGGTPLAHVPLELTVLAGTLPARSSLHLGGWDYTNRQNYLGLTAGNVGALVEQLHALNVDSPWATSNVLPPGTFDVLGHMVKGPDPSMFDQWVARWPGASRYFVFVNAQGALGTVPKTSGVPFATAVAQWLTFWVAHAAQLGIQPSQLMLLLVDEPHTAAQDDQIVTWATAIKAAQPEIGIWEDPNFADPATAAPRLLDVTDVVALERSQLRQYGVPLVQFYQQWATGTRGLSVYGADGPARLLDPYAYDRLQAWICADIGASGSFFWSFADDAGGSSWNEYRSTQAPYSPFFLSSTAVTISKHSEAIREGLEDFEYLTMLRHTTGQDTASLYQHALDTVLRSPGASDQMWASSKDRSAADSMRLMIAGALGLVLPLPPPVISPMSDLIMEATSGAGAVVTYAAPATSDALDGSGVAECSPASGWTFPVGTTSVVCSAQDSVGNSAASGFAVTVLDTTPPVLAGVPLDVFVEATGAAGAPAFWTQPIANDLVDGSVSVTCLPQSASLFALGVTRVTCTAADSRANSAQADFDVRVIDTTAPMLILPDVVVVDGTSPLGVSVIYAASATDAVSGIVPTTCEPLSSSTFPVGTTAVNCSATDGAGNVSTGQFAVTVLDTTPPSAQTAAPPLRPQSSCGRGCRRSRGKRSRPKRAAVKKR